MFDDTVAATRLPVPSSPQEPIGGGFEIVGDSQASGMGGRKMLLEGTSDTFGLALSHNSAKSWEFFLSEIMR